jgi:hypothetical protein
MSIKIKNGKLTAAFNSRKINLALGISEYKPDSKKDNFNL